MGTVHGSLTILNDAVIIRGMFVVIIKGMTLIRTVMKIRR